MIFEAVRMGGLVCLAALLPFVVNPGWYDLYYWPKVQGLYVTVALLGAFALWQERESCLRSLASRVGIALAVWLGVVGMSTLFSVNPIGSLVGEDYRYEGLLTWLAYGVVVARVASGLTTAWRIRVLLSAVLASAVVMAVLGLMQHFGWSPVPEDLQRTGWTRAWGTTGSPLALGAYLVLVLPVALGLYARESRPGWRWVYGGGVVLLYAALVATRTRAAWGALAAGLAVWAVTTGWGRLRAAARPLFFLGVALAAVTPVMLLTGGLSPARPSPADVSNPRSVDQRLFLWRTVAPLVGQRPLLGWGPETLSQIYPAYATPEFQEMFPEAKMMRIVVDRPHNDLLQQVVATGFIGLAAYGWMWSALFRTAWRVGRDGEREDVACIAAGLLGGFAAYFVQLQFSFSYVSVAPVFWSFVGLLLALERGPAQSETGVRMVYGITEVSDSGAGHGKGAKVPHGTDSG